MCALSPILRASAWVPGRATSHPGQTLASPTSTGGLLAQGRLAVLAGAVPVFVALTGAEITTVAAAESPEPPRAVARLSPAVIVRILAFYVFSIVLILCVVP